MQDAGRRDRNGRRVGDAPVSGKTSALQDGRAGGWFKSIRLKPTADGKMFEMVDRMEPNAVIKVIGVGGGGGNAVSHMVNAQIEGVDFVCANTDAQALKNSGAKHTLQLGANVTKGLGAGANPEVGRQAALEDRERICELLQGADMAFITCGMGGGTGTGAAPVVAQLAKEMGILTVAVVTKPFPFEGRRRMQVALKGIEDLTQHVDSLITVPNEKLLTVLGRDVTLLSAFKQANDVLLGAVQGIADLITRPGLINVDFADVRTVMSEMGMAMMGSGNARGDDRAVAAAEAAINNPLLEDINLAGACGILVNVTAGSNLTMREFDEIGGVIHDFASEDATVVIGTALDPELQDEIRVTVVATGLNRNAARVPVRSEREREAMIVQRPAIKVVRNGSTGEVDYVGVPGRVAATASGTRVVEQAGTAAENPDNYLDIPAFLRRQAD
jgi:cell division protein FtsZ